MQSYTEFEPLQKQKDTFLAGHVWYSAFTPAGVFQSGPGGILAILFWVYFFYLATQSLVQVIIQKCCSGLKLFIGDVNVDEQIDEYQNCLDDDDRQWTISEEKNSR